ncbi:hypothetical protein GGR53DRAFT_462835 [Hypoxylon sp. FL1150]|nr:hypothetical protein GGR53DRAFT_462835 [Hypoxylon sp. FL1150]
MDSQKSVLYFYSLSVIAVLALWGVSLWNGTVEALIRAVWQGELHGGLPLKTDYTGVPLIDYPVAILVAFFHYGTSGHDEGYQLFLLSAYSALQPAFVWLYVEESRPQSKPKWISRPVVFGLLWQCFGGAISLPLYYANHLCWVSQSNAEIARVSNPYRAMALPFSFLFGAVLPTVIGMAPTWLGPYSRSSAIHQTILAAWQPDPVWVSLILLVLTKIVATLFSDRKLRGNASRDAERRKASQWICASYVLAAISSSMGHLYVITRVVTSHNRAVDVVRMYVPFLSTGPYGASDILVRGPWLFLQYDFIIISLSSLSWAFLLLGPIHSRWRISATSLALIMMTSSAVIGPGATVSIALLLREGHLPDRKFACLAPTVKPGPRCWDGTCPELGDS